MRIVNYVHTTKEEVEGRKHNIWIGISLGNKYFTQEHIQKYIAWALEHTREKVLVVIADFIHAINLEVFDRRSSEAANRKAMDMGKEREAEIQKLLATFSHEEQQKISVVRWKDALRHSSYQKNLEIIRQEYATNPDFHAFILTIVKEGRSDRASRFEQMTEREKDRLAEYILHELPHFIDGVQAYNDDCVYTLLPYPGLSKLDDLFLGLQTGTMFPNLAKKLHITHSIGIVEAYAE